MNDPLAFGTRSRRDFITGIAAAADATILGPRSIIPSVAAAKI